MRTSHLKLVLVVSLVCVASAQTPLNMSRDLVGLGIASTNMVPNQPALDAGPLFVQAVAYAKNNGITRLIADPGAYYFLNLLESNAHVGLRNINNMTIDFQGSDLIFTQPLFYGMVVYSSTNSVLQNFTVDYQPLPADSGECHQRFSYSALWQLRYSGEQYNRYRRGHPHHRLDARHR